MAGEGYRSVEEHIGECTEFFLLLQRGEAQKQDGASCGMLRRIEEKALATGIFLPSEYLRECCGLTRTEYWLVMLAFCCEVEEGLCLAFREKYREKWPSLQYALHLLSTVLPVDFHLIGELCGRESALGGLLNQNPQGAGEGGCLMRPLLLARAPFYFLLTGGFVKEDWYALFLPQMGEWEEEKDAPFLPLHEKERALLGRYLENADVLRLLLHAGRGCGKHILLQRACRKQCKNAIFVRFSRLWRKGEREREQAVQTLRFFCKLLTPLVVFEFSGEGSAIGAAGEEGNEQEFFSLLNEEFAAEKTVILTENPYGLGIAEKYSDIKIFLAETLSAAERKLAVDMWLKPQERQEWQEELLARFHMNIGELVRIGKSLCVQAAAECVSRDNPALWEKVLARAGSGSGGIGKLVEERADLDEIVLPQECRKQLETVLKLAKVWTGRQGMQILFHGSSGTGKTMAASILARQLKRPLFKVDLSQVFDKYIGETEKQINKIFQTAERGSYVLFFDEADALFAKRTGIQDSHDRYANVSTSYLLQRMEEYRGVLILATNLIDHFDDAFVRRIRFVIRFRNLDDKGRKLLWERALSGGLPVGDDVSFAELAQAAQLSPARIYSAAQVAKMLALCGQSGEEAEVCGADGKSAGSCGIDGKSAGLCGVDGKSTKVCGADAKDGKNGSMKGSRSITREIVWEALELEAGKDETRLRFTGGYLDGKGL